MKKDLISLESFNQAQSIFHTGMNSNLPVYNGISCPKCGSELMDSRPMFTLMSKPPQKDVHCPKCGYIGFRIA